MDRAVKSFRAARDEAISAFPEVEEKAKELRRIKENVLENINNYIDKVEIAVKRAHGHFHFAKDSDEANKIIANIVGSDKLVLKAKSITSEELLLNDYLEKNNNTVYETDLGEFIVQLLKSRPMHILAPAVNIPREKVKEIFSKLAGRDLPTDPTTLSKYAREFLRDKFFKADVGISGANAITSDTGTLFLIENEGNIRLATAAPRVHIALVGVEKILPTLTTGMLMLEVVMRYAGYLSTSYVSLISGPSKTGDIEKVKVYGAHGPEEFHVVMLDNGRIKASQDKDLREFLLCLRCGACMYECPVFSVTSGEWGYRYMGGIGVPWTAYVSGGLKKAAMTSYTCTMCGRCVRHCPMSINTPHLVQRVREDVKNAQYLPPFVTSMLEGLLDKGHL